MASRSSAIDDRDHRDEECGEDVDEDEDDDDDDDDDEHYILSIFHD